MLNNDGQPLDLRYNGERNKSKALFNLLGVLNGITADQTLNEHELLYLHSWLANYPGLKNDGDVQDILYEIESAIQDKIITSDEREDILSLIATIIDYRKTEDEFVDLEDAINHLLGHISGIAADGNINDTEIHHLHSWLTHWQSLRNTHPADLLIKRINNMLSDKHIDEAERADLLETIEQITGCKFKKYGLASAFSTSFGASEPESLEYANKNICVTGKFIIGSRAFVHNLLRMRGGTVVTTVNQKTDVLIVGSIASRDWRMNSYGRKYESALELQQKRHNIVIITEDHWQRIIDRT